MDLSMLNLDSITQCCFILSLFYIRSDMVVRSIGNSLLVILPDLVGKKITNWFDLVRPLIAFKFQTVSREVRVESKPHDNICNAKLWQHSLAIQS